MKCSSKRGWAASQRWIAGVLCVELLSSTRCTCRSSGTSRVDGGQELLELDRAVAAVQRADDLAGGDVQRGVEARRAGALVVVGGALGDARAASAGSARCGPSAWIWDFSSTHSTTARSGGLRYSPTTSRTLSMNSGSFDSFQDSWRWGCSPNARQIRDTADCVSPTSAGHRARRPVRGVLGRALQGLDDHLLDLGVGHRPRPPRTRLVGQAVKPISGKPIPPLAHRGVTDLQPLRRSRCSSDPRPPAARSAARNASAWALDGRRVQRSNSARSTSSSSITTATGSGITEPYNSTRTNDSRH